MTLISNLNKRHNLAYLRVSFFSLVLSFILAIAVMLTTALLLVFAVLFSIIQLLITGFCQTVLALVRPCFHLNDLTRHGRVELTRFTFFLSPTQINSKMRKLSTNISIKPLRNLEL